MEENLNKYQALESKQNLKTKEICYYMIYQNVENKIIKWNYKKIEL